MNGVTDKRKIGNNAFKLVILSLLILALSVQISTAAADTPQYEMKLIWEFQKNTKITCADISPDSTRIVAAGGSSVYMLGRDGSIIWENKFDGTINDVATSIDGRYTVFVTESGYFYKLDSEGKQLVIKYLRETPSFIDISEDGKTAVAGTRYNQVCMIGEQGNIIWKQGLSGMSSGVAASDSMEVIATAGDQGSLVVYYNTGTQKWTKSINEKATCVDVSPSGDIVAIGLLNGDVIRYDADNGEEIFRNTLPFIPKSISLSDKGTDMAVSGEGNATIYVYNVDFKNFEPITVTADSPVRSVKLSKPANNLAAVLDSGILADYYMYPANIVQPTPEPTVTTVPDVPFKINTLRIESNPKGAQVFTDNILKGITPVTVTDLGGGLHSLKIRLEGYQEWNKEFYLDEGENIIIEAELTPVGIDMVYLVILGVVSVLIIAVIIVVIRRRNKEDDYDFF